MNEERASRVPTGLIWLLIYQWILVLVAVCMVCGAIASIPGAKVTATEALLGSFELLVLACWGTAMVFASVGMVRRSRRGFLLGMICHVLLGILALVGVLIFVCLWFSFSRSESGQWVWDPFFLIFALMWLPFALISAWAFFYLRRLRKRLS